MPRNKIPGLPLIEDMVHSLLDLYEKDGIQTGVMLDVMPQEWLNDGASYVILSEQKALMLASSEASRLQIQRKTLMDTGTLRHPHQQLDKLTAPGTQIKNEEPDFFDHKMATAYGLSVHAYLEERIRQELTKEKLDVVLLRFFADRIDPLVSAIEQLDDTDFSKLVPDKFVPLFSECHINFILGNHGTSAILCGVILERALQDLLPSEKTGQSLVEEAKVHALLEGVHRQWAYSVIHLRNQLAHGGKEFESTSPDEVWKCLINTRSLIKHLYNDRINT